MAWPPAWAWPAFEHWMDPIHAVHMNKITYRSNLRTNLNRA